MSDTSEPERPLSDSDLVGPMGRWAAEFVDGAASLGKTLTWSPADAADVDALCDEFLRGGPSKSEITSAAMRLSAYVGEMLVRGAGGQWRYDETTNGPAIRMPGGELLQPMEIAVVRLHGKQPDAIRRFVAGAMVSADVATTPMQDLSDAEVARKMREVAEVFVEVMAANGEHLGWEAVHASRLDDICDEILKSDPPDSVLSSTAMTMGSYLGELLVRTAGGRWTYDPEADGMGVTMPNGLRAFPHNKVAKRLRHGKEHNIFQFYWHATTADLPPPMPGAE